MVSDEQYHVIFEIVATPCEWGGYIRGSDCPNYGTYTILDIKDKSDPDYPEGFHTAHLCSDHILAALQETRLL